MEMLEMEMKKSPRLLSFVVLLDEMSDSSFLVTPMSTDYVSTLKQKKEKKKKPMKTKNLSSRKKIKRRRKKGKKKKRRKRRKKRKEVC